jgi:hypothetical protein
MKESDIKKGAKKELLDTKNKKITAGIITAAILIIIIVIMVIESGVKSQMTVSNNTDMNLEYVKVKYILYDEDLTNSIQTDKIDANKSLTMNIIPANLLGVDGANFRVTFKFEGQNEIYADAGSFSDKFQGKMKIKFSKTEDPNLLKMTVKADTGLFSSELIDCNEVFTVDLSKGIVYND